MYIVLVRDVQVLRVLYPYGLVLFGVVSILDEHTDIRTYPGDPHQIEE